MCTGLIKNYIKPYIGNRYVRSFTVRDVDAHYTMLLDKPAVVVSGHLDTGAKITAHTIGRIHKLLKSAFGKAVVWEYTAVNPTIGATLPTAKAEKREVWSDDEAIAALSACKEQPLRICLYLALGCSMRLGEILGLQWANVHIEDELVAEGAASQEYYNGVLKEVKTVYIIGMIILGILVIAITIWAGVEGEKSDLAAPLAMIGSMCIFVLLLNLIVGGFMPESAEAQYSASSIILDLIGGILLCIPGTIYIIIVCSVSKAVDNA